MRITLTIRKHFHRVNHPEAVRSPLNITESRNRNAAIRQLSMLSSCK